MHAKFYPRHRNGLYLHPDRLTRQDLHVIREVIHQDCYGVKPLSRYPIRTVLDVGAHIGCFSRVANDVWQPDKIVSVEACYDNVDVLRLNVGDFATILHCAVWKEHGTVTLLNSMTNNGDATGGSIVVSERPEQIVGPYEYDERPVPARTLRRIIDEHFDGKVDLVKFDCEGCESVLALDDSSLASISHVRMEWHSREILDSVSARLVACGFSVKVPVDNGNIGILFAERLK